MRGNVCQEGVPTGTECAKWPDKMWHGFGTIGEAVAWMSGEKGIGTGVAKGGVRPR